MENWQYYIKLGGLIFGASGIWQLVALFIRAKMDKKLKAAETKHFNVQSEAQIVGNWIQWAQHLEQQVKELESVVKGLEEVSEENKSLVKFSKLQQETIESLKLRIKALQDNLQEVIKEKENLLQQIAKLKKK